jgi:hypothetical protein
MNTASATRTAADSPEARHARGRQPSRASGDAPAAAATPAHRDPTRLQARRIRFGLPNSRPCPDPRRRRRSSSPRRALLRTGGAGARELVIRLLNPKIGDRRVCVAEIRRVFGDVAADAEPRSNAMITPFVQARIVRLGSVRYSPARMAKVGRARRRPSAVSALRRRPDTSQAASTRAAGGTGAAGAVAPRGATARGRGQPAPMGRRRPWRSRRVAPS